MTTTLLELAELLDAGNTSWEDELRMMAEDPVVVPDVRALGPDPEPPGRRLGPSLDGGLGSPLRVLAVGRRFGGIELS